MGHVDLRVELRTSLPGEFHPPAADDQRGEQGHGEYQEEKKRQKVFILLVVSKYLTARHTCTCVLVHVLRAMVE